MDSRMHLRLLRSSLLIFVMMTVGVASAHAQGRGGGRGGGGGATEVETVTITIGTFSGAQVVHDGDPVYEDRRMVYGPGGGGNACVTSTWNGRLVFSHFDRGENQEPFFSECNIFRPADARKINLRFPMGSCECLVLAPGAGDDDGDGYCDVDIVDIDDGNARIRANDVFKKKLGRGADFNLLFHHDGASYEVQYEGTPPYQGDDNIKTLITKSDSRFRLVEVGGPTMCSGFEFPLDITMERVVVTVPGGS